MRKVNVLFIIKNRLDSYGVSYGLNNSAKFVSNALDLSGINSEVEFVVDGNDINRVVTKYRPEVVVIEAIWATPEKIEELTKIHTNTHWVIRVHSKIPFLAMEGMSLEWIKKYVMINHVTVAFNNEMTNRNFADVISSKVKFLPNIYQQPAYAPTVIKDTHDHVIDIGCFGAIRPLKNTLLQAFAAIEFAKEVDKQLNFYINGNRIEQKGECIYKNILALFQGTQHNLIQVPWVDHYEFIKIIANMDINLQVSYSESFNIVSADSFYTGCPAVVSNEMSWVNASLQVRDLNDMDSIIQTMHVAYSDKARVVRDTIDKLEAYNYIGIRTWINFLNRYIAI